MRILVALQAFTVELVEHGVVVRLFVAVTAVRDSGMLALMAEGAVESPMLGLALGEQLKDFGVARPAVLRRDVVGVLDVERAVGLVAAQTVFKDQEIGVWLVTLQTPFDLLMLGGVAEGAVFGGVLTREILELLPLLWMAGLAADANRGDIVDGYISWRMGITMTGQAVGQFEVLTVTGRMAHRTLGDRLLTQGQVFEVAVSTGDLGLMLAAVPLDVGWLTVVAFDAVAVLQLGLGLGFKKDLLLGTHRFFARLALRLFLRRACRSGVGLGADTPPDSECQAGGDGDRADHGCWHAFSGHPFLPK